jgi:hypothetical protein
VVAYVTRPCSCLALSAPIIVAQDRGYREGYACADLVGHHNRHDWQVGVDSIFSPVHENLEYGWNQIWGGEIFGGEGMSLPSALFAYRSLPIPPSGTAPCASQIRRGQVSHYTQEGRGRLVARVCRKMELFLETEQPIVCPCA